MDLPIKLNNGGSFHSYLSLPEGNTLRLMLDSQRVPTIQRQVVLLGAGYDMRGARLKLAEKKVKVFEAWWPISMVMVSLPLNL